MAKASWRTTSSLHKKLRDSISNISAIIEETTAKDEEITATILTLTGEGK